MRHRIASLALSLLLAPALASADATVPRPPESGDGPGSRDWKDRCADRVTEARTEALVEDAAFQEGAKQKWTGKRDIEYHNVEADTFQWQAVVVDEGTVPAPKPTAQEWSANYHRFKLTPLGDRWRYMNQQNQLMSLDLVEQATPDKPLPPSAVKVRFFRYEKRMNGWVAVLQATGMSPSTLRVYLNHFRKALEDCLEMAPRR